MNSDIEIDRLENGTSHPTEDDHPLVIDGRRVAGAGRLDVVNPATEEVFATCGRADMAQLEDAVAAAKRAFPAWSKLGVPARRGHLFGIADELEGRSDEFARLLTREQGKPLGQAAAEVAATVAVVRTLGALTLEPRVLDENATATIFEHRTPLGVVAAITPWNFPLQILAIKVAPALLAGNTVVAKPAPTTPLTTLLFADLCRAHLPPGVLNAIVDDNDLGAALAAHPHVAKVAFTGSTATGRRVMAGAAPTLKRLTLELGGNDAAIVLPDVDPRQVAPLLFAASSLNSGQVCVAVKRVFVHSSSYDVLCAELARLADAAVVDDGDKQGTQFGPVQNRAQYERLLGLLERARVDGQIVAGGDIPDRKGYFLRPAIVRDIGDDAQLVREEQFGPILPVLRYDDVDDAVERANSTEYGLGGSVWSNNVDTATAVAMRLDAGIVWVNKHMELLLDVPLRGSRQSGMGVELGREGLEEFTQAHVVSIAKSLA